jgi:hypothetical protein
MTPGRQSVFPPHLVLLVSELLVTEIIAEEAANEAGMKRRKTVQERKRDGVPTSPMPTLLAADQVDGERNPPGTITSVEEDRL